MKRRLIVLSAPSGTGKTTLCARLLRDFPQLQLSISTTTRAPRGQEQHGREYYFVPAADFRAEVTRERFAEWAEVHGNMYGTSKSMIESAFSSQRSVLLDIDVQGAEALKATYPTEAYLIFIAPPSMQVLEQRLRARGTDSEDTIQRRLRNARDEMKEAPKFDHTLVNDDLDKAYNELKRLVAAAMSVPMPATTTAASGGSSGAPQA